MTAPPEQRRCRSFLFPTRMPLFPLSTLPKKRCPLNMRTTLGFSCKGRPQGLPPGGGEGAHLADLVSCNPLLYGASPSIGATTGRPLFVVWPLIPSHEHADGNETVEAAPIGCWKMRGRAPTEGRDRRMGLTMAAHAGTFSNCSTEGVSATAEGGGTTALRSVPRSVQHRPSPARRASTTGPRRDAWATPPRLVWCKALLYRPLVGEGFVRIFNKPC